MTKLNRERLTEQAPKGRAKIACLKQVLTYYRSTYTEIATLGYDILAFKGRFCMAEVATKTGLTGFLPTLECLPKLDKVFNV